VSIKMYCHKCDILVPGMVREKKVGSSGVVRYVTGSAATGPYIHENNMMTLYPSILIVQWVVTK